MAELTPDFSSVTEMILSAWMSRWSPQLGHNTTCVVGGRSGLVSATTITVVPHLHRHSAVILIVMSLVWAVRRGAYVQINVSDRDHVPIETINLGKKQAWFGYKNLIGLCDRVASNATHESQACSESVARHGEADSLSRRAFQRFWMCSRQIR
jgi:hypothetical protein